MKVICLTNLYKSHPRHPLWKKTDNQKTPYEFIRLTPNKIYVGQLNKSLSNLEDEYLIKDDSDTFNSYPISLFCDLEIWRNKQIDSLIS